MRQIFLISASVLLLGCDGNDQQSNVDISPTGGEVQSTALINDQITRAATEFTCTEFATGSQWIWNFKKDNTLRDENNSKVGVYHWNGETSLSIQPIDGATTTGIVEQNGATIKLLKQNSWGECGNSGSIESPPVLFQYPIFQCQIDNTIANYMLVEGSLQSQYGVDLGEYGSNDSITIDGYRFTPDSQGLLRGPTNRQTCYQLGGELIPVGVSG